MLCLLKYHRFQIISNNKTDILEIDESQATPTLKIILMILMKNILMTVVLQHGFCK